jgi:hypothetical protein
MAVHFHKTSSFEEARINIEQHLYDSVIDIEKDIDLALRSVEQFAEAVARLMDTLEQMYQTPGAKDTSNEKSFPIREGRYRVFFKVTLRSNQEFDITFLDIDDNQQSNLDRFPSHRLITFESESE